MPQHAAELDGATERFLIDMADVTGRLSDAAGHVADALPELLILAKGGDRFPDRVRPYLTEVIHCLASALESTLSVSRDVGRAGVGGPRKDGEEALAIVATDFLERFAG